MDKWFMLQIAHASPAKAVRIASDLTENPDFDWKNPNRFRSVIGGLTMGNPAGFHAKDGSGYRFVSEWILRMDKGNPQTAARMSTAFETWRRYDANRQTLMRGALEQMAGTEGISRDLSEMAARMLNG